MFCSDCFRRAYGETYANGVFYDPGKITTAMAAKTGQNLAAEIERCKEVPAACYQIDFSMADAGIETGISVARERGYFFCSWLPGFGRSDVARLQKIDETATDRFPELVNPFAQSLLRWLQESQAVTAVDLLPRTF